jgi:hypothetical protein
MSTADKCAVPAQEQSHAVTPRADSTAWDPYEVWLKRVKQPREHENLPHTHAISTHAIIHAESGFVRHVWLRLRPHS